MAKYLDIETAPKPVEELESIMPEFSAPSNWKDAEKIAQNIAEQRNKFIEEAALSPLTGTVLAWGIYDDETEKYCDADRHIFTESELLSELWSRLTDGQNVFTEDVITFNGNRFDVSFLFKRSWANRVKVPPTVFECYRGRFYLNGRFKDLSELFCLGTDKRFVSLNSALSLLGLPQKQDIGGKLPYEIFESDPQLFHDYLRRDVMGLVEINNVVGL